MREADEQAEHMFSDVSPEQRVPSDHPLRAVRVLTDEAVAFVVAAIRQPVRDDWPSLDSARAVATGPGTAGALYAL